MKLELKHLAAYLPYNIEVAINNNHGSSFRENLSICNITESGISSALLYGLKVGSLKLYGLRPISDLTKEINHNGKIFVPINKINSFKLIASYPNEKYEGFCDREIESDLCFSAGGPWEGGTESDINSFQFYKLYTLLHEWHFDTFGLIDAGLAIDINTLQQ